HALPPEFLGLREVLGISGVLATGGHALVRVELELGRLEQVGGEGDALFETLVEAVENLEGRGGVATVLVPQREVVQLGAVMIELLEVLLREMDMLRIEGLQVAVEKLLRVFVI